MITLTLDLYFKGVSLRKISDHLKQFYNLRVHYTTIYRWIEKYIQILNEYISTLKPVLSYCWHADEMMVKVAEDEDGCRMLWMKEQDFSLQACPHFDLYWNILQSSTFVYRSTKFYSFSAKTKLPYY